jgi:16S rRNA (guanine1207-N2)-methyltransferase
MALFAREDSPVDNPIDTAWSVIQRVVDGDLAGFQGLAAKGTCLLEPEACASLLALIDGLRLAPGSEALGIHQTFKPTVDVFRSKGFTPSADGLGAPSSLVLFVPTRQRVESLALLARGLLHLDEGGVLIFACANAQGAGGFVSQIKEVFPQVEVESARKCRWIALPAASVGEAERSALGGWLRAAEKTTIEGTGFVSVPGIYGWNKVDRGSELLIDSLPELEGPGADLGAGYGYLSHRILSACPRVTGVALVEAEQRALVCARENLEPWRAVCHFLWLDVASPECRQQLKGLSWIVMNPPFHSGSRTDVELGQEFIKTAAGALMPGGRLFMVANAFLAYEDVLQSKFARVERALAQDGFKVLHATR